MITFLLAAILFVRNQARRPRGAGVTADDSIIAPMVQEAAAKYAAEKKITTGCLLTN